MSPPCPFTTTNPGTLPPLGNRSGKYKIAGTRVPHSVAYVTASATTPGAGTNRRCVFAASTGSGSGTKKFVRIAARSSPTRSGVHDSARTPAVSRDPDNSNLMAARTRRGVKKIPMQSHPFGKHDFITSEIGFGAGCTAAGSPEHSLALPFPPSLVFFAP